MKKRIVISLSMLLTIGACTESPQISGIIDTAHAASAGDQAENDLRVALKGVLPNDPDDIRPSAVDGFYEVVVGNDLLYVSADARYMFVGALYEVGSGTNLTEQHRNGRRKVRLDELDQDTVITFSAEDAEKPKHTITVFTDVDCGYCRKLHQEIKQINALGIEVRYAAFPRAGVGSESFRKMEYVWCADDRNHAMDLAKALAPVPERRCKNPVAEQYQLGRELGVRGTPAIFLEDGTLVPGYLPPDRLLQTINSHRG